jgi:prevent-host-death family protein
MKCQQRRLVRLVVALVPRVSHCGPVKPITVREAKTHLSRLIERANAGQEIIISKRGQPYARLVALPVRRPKRESGTLKDFVKLGGAFFESLPPGWTSET